MDETFTFTASDGNSWRFVGVLDDGPSWRRNGQPSHFAHPRCFTPEDYRAAADVVERWQAPRSALIRQVGAFWLVRGRHRDGFVVLDALNYCRERALEEADRLLPQITDAMVDAAQEMRDEEAKESLVW